MRTHSEPGDNERTKEAFISVGTCDICEAENMPTLAMDGSDGEYGCLSVCLQCVAGWFYLFYKSDEGKEWLNES